MKSIKYYLKHPLHIFIPLGGMGFFKWMNDQTYQNIAFYIRLHKKLDLTNPQTFNEKLQWCKLYDRRPEYTTMVDKYEVKRLVSDLIGEEYIIPTIGVWDDFDAIEFEKLPNRFVLKCTHDSGGLIICKDKASLDMGYARKKIRHSLKNNYYWRGREWPYKNVKPRILVEQYMQDKNSDVLPVYKFFCFDSEPRIIQTIQNDKQPNESIDYFDADWNLLELRQNYPNSKAPLPKPDLLEEMLTLTRKLAQGKQGFIRVDLYVVNGRIYFSEYTFFSDGGFAYFEPPEWDAILGRWITLPKLQTNMK